MSGTHKYPTISFRISPREREEIEAKIFASGMKKKAYLGGGMDNEQIQQAGLANEARDMTKKLAALAEKYQCAIVLEADWNNRLGHNEQCEQSSHQRQEIKRHIEAWVRLISLQSLEAFS